jgi:hypothetical protein
VLNPGPAQDNFCLCKIIFSDDLAHSMMDGRFRNQIENMKRWRLQFLQEGTEGSLKYLVEGDPDQYVVKCVCGCRGVGKCGNPNPEVVQVRACVQDRMSLCMNPWELAIFLSRSLCVFSLL